MSAERTWTGNSEVDAAIVMLDRIDCSPGDDSRVDEVEATLRRLHASNQELEAMLEAVGAGVVSAQRITQGKGHIEQDLKMVAVQEPFGYFKAEPFGWRDCAETDEGAIALYEAPQPQADALDEEREKLLRALYDRGYEDRAKERDYDPLGASEFDAAMCAPRAGAARAKQADALDAESWVSESDSKPLEADGEVFVRFSDGTFGTGGAAYWHGASNDFAQWCHPDPDEDRTVTHWMKPPTIDAAQAAKENKGTP